MFNQPSRALDVVGEVMMAVDGEDVKVAARGDTIVVELANLRSVRNFLSRNRGRAGRRAMVERIHDALIRADLTLLVALKSRTVGRLGVGARPGLFSRVFGVGPMEIWPRGIRPAQTEPPGRPG